MTDTKNHSNSAQAGSLQGRVFRPQSRQELVEAIELAFDYRGDVTVELSSGELLVGYLFNREAHGAAPWIELFPAGTPDVRRVFYEDIVTIAFSGEDTASGKSWAHWVAKKESERHAEAARLVAEAQARGHL